MTTTTIPRADARAKGLACGEPGAGHLATFVAGHASRPVAMASRLFPNDPGLGDRLRALIEGWREASPDPGATERQAATHEAAHFAAAEVVGLGASHAQINRQRGRGGDWSGRTVAQRQPLHDGRPRITAADVTAEAVFCLAGPLAEQIVGSGDAYGSPGEILEFGVLAASAADMLHEDRAATLCDLWARTTGLVIGRSEQIERIADRLTSAAKRESGIFRDSRGVPKILNSLTLPLPEHHGPLTINQSRAMNFLLNNTPVDLTLFVEEIGR